MIRFLDPPVVVATRDGDVSASVQVDNQTFSTTAVQDDDIADPKVMPELKLVGHLNTGFIASRHEVTLDPRLIARGHSVKFQIGDTVTFASGTRLTVRKNTARPGHMFYECTWDDGSREVSFELPESLLVLQARKETPPRSGVRFRPVTKHGG